MKLNVLTIRFQNRLAPHEVPLFRGAVIAALDHKLPLFHNHEGDGFRYHYPLIQYKALGGRAAIVCLAEGTEQVGELFAGGNLDVVMGERSETLVVDSVRPMSFNLQLWQQTFEYGLNRWAPLSVKNYALWRTTESLAERYAMLERVLTGNILSMAKGVGLRFDDRVECRITAMDGEPYWMQMKDVKVLAMNVRFKSNVSLPTGIGLGKHAALNCGIVSRVRPPQ